MDEGGIVGPCLGYLGSIFSGGVVNGKLGGDLEVRLGLSPGIGDGLVSGESLLVLNAVGLGLILPVHVHVLVAPVEGQSARLAPDSLGVSGIVCVGHHVVLRVQFTIEEN